MKQHNRSSNKQIEESALIKLIPLTSILLCASPPPHSPQVTFPAQLKSSCHPSSTAPPPLTHPDLTKPSTHLIQPRHIRINCSYIPNRIPESHSLDSILVYPFRIPEFPSSQPGHARPPFANPQPFPIPTQTCPQIGHVKSSVIPIHHHENSKHCKTLK